MWEGENVLADLLSQFQEQPPFRITSLLPYAGDVLLFPKPMLTLPLEREAEEKQDIRLKNICFISQGILEPTLRSEPLDEHLARDNFYQDGRVWLTQHERTALPLDRDEPVLWRRYTTSKSTMDRQAQAFRIYHTGQVSFCPGCGLYFLLEVEDSASKKLVESALHYLSGAGLGGERSAGYGQFSFESASPFAPFWSSNGDLLITLSLYHPTLQELEAGVLARRAAYELSHRSGWVNSPERAGHRRKSASFIVEGSVLCSVGKPSYGELVDVTPELEPDKHPVYRYGFAFPIGVQEGEDSHEP
jgi:CRISPR-associated protein Csm4